MIDQIIQYHFGPCDNSPSEIISRDEWQFIVEAVIISIRKKICNKAFGLSSAEISTYYHLPISKFKSALKDKIGA